MALLEVRTRPTFLETLISKYDFGPVKLLVLSRNGPLARKTIFSSSVSKNREVYTYAPEKSCINGTSVHIY